MAAAAAVWLLVAAFSHEGGAMRVERSLTNQTPGEALAEIRRQVFAAAGKRQNLSAPDVLLPDEWRWNRRVRVLEKVAEGGHGQVFKCEVRCHSRHGADVADVAVKFIESGDTDYADVEDEVSSMRRMAGSKYVVSTTGSPSYIEDDRGKWVMMPFMNGGDMSKLMDKCQDNKECHCNAVRRDGARHECWESLGDPISLPYVLALFYHVARGLEELHIKGLVHMDVKPLNVMMNCQGDRCYAALADLGLACGPSSPCKPAGTPLYFAPEVADGTAVGDPANDMFAMGVMLYQFLYGYNPPWAHSWYGFMGISEDDVKSIKEYDRLKDDRVPTELSDIDLLVQDLIQGDYTKRPTAGEVATRAAKFIRSQNPTTEVLEMLEKTPQQRGLVPSMPNCLMEWKKPESWRAGCSIPGVPYEGYASWMVCGPCPAFCNPCCECLKRSERGSMEEHYFRAPTCT